MTQTYQLPTLSKIYFIKDRRQETSALINTHYILLFKSPRDWHARQISPGRVLLFPSLRMRMKSYKSYSRVPNA